MGFLNKSTKSELTVSRSYDDPVEPPQPRTATRMTVRQVTGEEVEIRLPPLVPFDPTTFINPSSEAVKEVASLASGQSGSIELLLSIGGANTVWGDKICSPPRTLQNKLDKSSMDINDEVGHESMRLGFHHQRLNVELGFHTLGRNEWRPQTTGEETFGRIERATDGYMQRLKLGASDVDRIGDVARILVEKRRRRANTVQWQQWATGRTS